jgi:glycosyltransferase involved in cell wall biosynthesis
MVNIKKSDLRVCLIGGPYLPVPPVKYGGTEQVMKYILQGLKGKCDTILIGPGDSTIDCKVYPTCKEHVFFAKTEEEFYEHQLLVDKTNIVLKEQILQVIDQVDIFHSHYMYATNLLRQMMENNEIKSIPILTTLHGTYEHMFKEFYEDNGHLPFNSISKNQRNAYPTYINWVANVYNAMDPSDFEFNPEPEDYMCFLGRLDRDKNPHMAIEFAIANDSKIKIAGKIDHLGKHYYDTVLEPLMEHELVEYVGELNLIQKAKFLRNAKLNLHPTGFREPFGLTIVEAAMSGTPTIAVKRGALPELIEQNRTGLVVEDFQEAYHLYDDFITDVDREYISVRAGMLFHFQKMADKYLSIYIKLVNAEA